jgi:hypothetical protein
MAQIFKPSANTIARGSLLLAGLLPVVGFYVGSSVSRSPYNTNAHVALNQPVPFSHKHHVEELGIDCRYCHPSVEKSPSAGIPPTETCMTCHSQIWTNSPLLEVVRKGYETNTPIQFANGDVGWNQLNRLPAFVYFNHAIHVDRGISCNACHGPVQSMMMTYKQQAFSMAWCLDCHRNVEKHLWEDEKQPQLSPRQRVFELYKKVQEGTELTPRELALVDPDNRSFKPAASDVARGKELMEQYAIKKKQLEDCWTCHR